QLLELDPGKYTPHPLHAPDRDWTETNCWLDMMIEVMHVLGLEPLAASSFTLSTDFDGDQWRLFKFPPEDLRVLFGLEIDEMYVWRPVIDHLEDNLRLGRLLTVEVDAYFLPDTGGVSYRIDHLKTAIVPQMLDRPGRRLGYFHNAGYFELDGEDFDGIFSLDGAPDPRRLLPYVEIVRTDRLRAGEPPLDLVLSLTRDHLARRPATNPIARFKKRLQSDLPWLEEAGEAVFHPYSFGTSRQLGATAALAAAFVDWLDARLHAGLDEASRQFRHLSESAKALQFALARVVRGRHVEVDAPFESMEKAWESAMGTLAERLAPTGAATGPGSPN
ncbi:MAG TPA: DUF1839 family protein, partial [Acidimicrobiales bacterium]|nr:DUF1839 family protein [Acidimicrobiales bacterium]